MALNASYYATYEYAGLDGVLVDAAGRRNADTALSPSLPIQGGFESRLYDNFGRMFFVSLDIQL